MTVTKWRFRLLSSIALVALLGPLPSRAQGATPTSVVESLHDILLTCMKDAEQLGYHGRYQMLEPVLNRSFDLDFMARKSVGRHWKNLDEANQQRWLQTFERLTTANYAGRFDGYSGQSFETLGEEPAAHETVVVRTKLVLPDDDDVQLNYRLHQNGESWQIVDVYLNGTVSELALRRSEYASVLKRGDFDTLVAQVDQRVADLAQGTITASPAGR
jgi:phospholipid transport system substrate-binding protein